MTRLIQPGRRGRAGRAVDVEVVDDQVRGRIVLMLTRDRGPRMHLVASVEQGLDIALAIAGAAMRLRGGMEP